MTQKHNRHVIVALRGILGMKQSRFAEFIGCSIHAIQSLETQRLRLSDKLALQISEKTGVDAAGLLRNDPNAPLISRSGVPFTQATFEGHLRQARKPDNLWEIVNLHHAVADAFAWLCIVFLGAAQREEIGLLKLRVDETLAKLSERFCSDVEIQSQIIHQIARKIRSINELAPTIAKAFRDCLTQQVEEHLKKQNPHWTGKAKSGTNSKLTASEILKLSEDGFLAKPSERVLRRSKGTTPLK